MAGEQPNMLRSKHAACPVSVLEEQQPTLGSKTPDLQYSHHNSDDIIANNGDHNSTHSRTPSNSLRRGTIENHLQLARKSCLLKKSDTYSPILITSYLVRLWLVKLLFHARARAKLFWFPFCCSSPLVQPSIVRPSISRSAVGKTAS